MNVISRSEEISINKGSYEALWDECIDMAQELPGMHVEYLGSVATFFDGQPPTVKDSVELRWQGNAQLWNKALVVKRSPLFQLRPLDAEPPALYKDIIASMNQPCPKTIRHREISSLMIRDQSPLGPNPIRPQVVRDCLRRATSLRWECSPHPQGHLNAIDEITVPIHNAQAYIHERHDNLPGDMSDLSFIAAELAEVVRPNETDRYRAMYILILPFAIGGFSNDRDIDPDWPPISIGGKEAMYRRAHMQHRF